MNKTEWCQCLRGRIYPYLFSSEKEIIDDAINEFWHAGFSLVDAEEEIIYYLTEGFIIPPHIDI